MLESNGTGIDAVEAACCAVELDLKVNSVGVGGVPDRSGRVSLDSCVMLSPSRCGGVAFVRRFAHPVSIARRVMEDTQHVLLVGDGADDFAESQGFTPTDLLTESAEQRWRDMMSGQRSIEMTANREERTSEGDEPRHDSPHDTVGVLALDAAGTLAGACSTSGWPCKLPGRVGDSPIIGHGLYVDPNVGAAVATGHGELVMGTCSTFLAVELMRRGASPLDALTDALQRIADSYDLSDDAQVGMITLRPTGQWACAALRAGYRTAVRDAEQDDLVEPQRVILT